MDERTRERVAKLRRMTVANGCTVNEAATAKRILDELLEKHSGEPEQVHYGGRRHGMTEGGPPRNWSWVKPNVRMDEDFAKKVAEDLMDYFESGRVDFDNFNFDDFIRETVGANVNGRPRLVDDHPMPHSWVQANGKVVRISAMAEEHLLNTLAQLRRNRDHFKLCYLRSFTPQAATEHANQWRLASATIRAMETELRNRAERDKANRNGR